MNRLLNTIRVLVRRQRSRRHLMDLTQAQLKDIAITEEAAAREARKGFWK